MDSEFSDKWIETWAEPIYDAVEEGVENSWAMLRDHLRDTGIEFTKIDDQKSKILRFFEKAYSNEHGNPNGLSTPAPSDSNGSTRSRDIPIRSVSVSNRIGICSIL